MDRERATSFMFVCTWVVGCGRKHIDREDHFLHAHGSLNVEGSIWVERGPLPSCLSAHESLNVEEAYG